MGAFLDWFYAFATTIVDGIWKVLSGIVGGIFQIFNLGDHIQQISLYKDSFNVLSWVLFVLACLVFLGIIGCLIYLIYLGIRKIIRQKKAAVTNQDLLEEVALLHQNVVKLTKEKERILALKIGQTTISVDDLNAIFDDHEDEELAAATKDAEEKEALVGMPVRFMRLDAVDKKYEYYIQPEYPKDYTLQELCARFRNFCCSRMGLFYEEKVIRLMFAGLASTKLDL